MKSRTFAQKMTIVDDSFHPNLDLSTKDALELIGTHPKISLFLLPFCSLHKNIEITLV